MGETYDKPRDQLTAEEKARSLRYQIMDVVDQIKWVPQFGYDREMDWLTLDARLDDLEETILGSRASDLGMH